MTTPDRILVAGAPRSGSTWLAEVLARSPGVRLVHEPDNEVQQPFAVRAKAGLGRWPVLRPGETAPDEYVCLWQAAFDGLAPRRTPAWAAAKGMLRGASRDEMRAAFSATRRFSGRLRAVRSLAGPPARPGTSRDRAVLVKSVHSAFAVEWVAERFGPQVVVVVRHPLNIVASWAALGWGGFPLTTDRVVREYLEPLGITPLPAGRSPLAQLTWQVALLSLALEQAVANHPEWVVVSHEELCAAPAAGFAQLCQKLGLSWGEPSRRFLTESDRPGTGITTARVTAEQPDRWRRRLDDAQVEEIQGVLARFPLAARRS